MAEKVIQASTSASENPLQQEELLFIILVALPFPKIFQLRTVSKLWNSVLTSSDFLTTWSSRQPPWLVMARANNTPLASWTRELIAFDSAMDTWISLGQTVLSPPKTDDPTRSSSSSSSRGTDRSGKGQGADILKLADQQRADQAQTLEAPRPSFQLPQLLGNRRVQPDAVIYYLSDFQAVGSDEGGLACFLCYHFTKWYYAANGAGPATLQIMDRNAYYLILVLNPLTGSHSILPRNYPGSLPYGLDHFSISLQPLPHQHYRVFFLNPFMDDARNTYYPGDLDIYDSHTGCWTAGSSCKPHIHAKIGGVNELKGADFLHFVSQSGNIFAYSVELDEWRQLSLDLTSMPDPSRFRGVLKDANKAILIQHGDRVLVASVQQLEGLTPGLAGFGVWELMCPANANLHFSDDDDYDEVVNPIEVVEVARTPRHLWEGFYELDPIQHHASLKVKLICSGSLIAMTAHAIIGAGYGVFKYFVPLVYDLNRDLWYHLPSYKGQYDFCSIFGLRPSLVTVAQ